MEQIAGAAREDSIRLSDARVVANGLQRDCQIRLFGSLCKADARGPEIVTSSDI